MSIALPKGFRLAVTSAEFKTPGRPDLALAVSDQPAAAAGVFTTNLFKAAPVLIGQKTLQTNETAQAVLINTGQANACTGEGGLADCRLTQEMVAKALGLDPARILPASTGVIGVRLKMEAWRMALPALMANLGKADIETFARAIMTTDAFPKFAGEQVSLSGGEVRLVGIAKGAGMICPNMATMLSIVLCDGIIPPQDWRAMFQRVIKTTFNRVTVDGDTSTNDTLYGLANGASGVVAVEKERDILEATLTRVLSSLAYKLVQDGEGATKVLHVHVSGATGNAEAEQAARVVGHSQLVKTAMYGQDANWGRIVAALGRSGVHFNPADVRVCLCGVELFKKEQPTKADFETLLAKPLQQRDLALDISLGSGPGEYRLLASDLSHAYVSLNADYRS